MIRLHVTSDLAPGLAVAPTLDQSRYLTAVMRLNVGDEIVVKSSQKVTRLVRLKDISFFEILNKKFIEKMR